MCDEFKDVSQQSITLKCREFRCEPSSDHSEAASAAVQPQAQPRNDNGAPQRQSSEGSSGHRLAAICRPVHSTHSLALPADEPLPSLRMLYDARMRITCALSTSRARVAPLSSPLCELMRVIVSLDGEAAIHPTIDPKLRPASMLKPAPLWSQHSCANSLGRR